MRNPLEARRGGQRTPNLQGGYDDGRRTACRSLVAGPVRGGAARRLVELVLAPREHRDELGEIFDQIDQVAGRPTVDELIGVAARATAAHTCRGVRSLGASVAAVSAAVDRRFAACESGQAGYPLSLAGLGAAGRYGLENNLSPVYLTHALERIVESAVFVATVIDPACAPGAYPVRFGPRASTTDALRGLLGDHLARDQSATIDFALEELTSRSNGEPVAIDNLESVLLAVRGPIDVEQLVVAAHALVLSVCDDFEIDAELTAAAGILDGSGLSGGGWLALGGAAGAITGLAAGLVSSLFAAQAGRLSRSPHPPADRGPSAGEAAPLVGRRPAGRQRSDVREVARSVLRVSLVVAWCEAHGQIRPGTITIDRARAGDRDRGGGVGQGRGQDPGGGGGRGRGRG